MSISATTSFVNDGLVRRCNRFTEKVRCKIPKFLRLKTKIIESNDQRIQEIRKKIDRVIHGERSIYRQVTWQDIAVDICQLACDLDSGPRGLRYIKNREKLITRIVDIALDRSVTKEQKRELNQEINDSFTEFNPLRESRLLSSEQSAIAENETRCREFVDATIKIPPAMDLEAAGIASNMDSGSGVEFPNRLEREAIYASGIRTNRIRQFPGNTD